MQFSRQLPPALLTWSARENELEQKRKGEGSDGQVETPRYPISSEGLSWMVGTFGIGLVVCREWRSIACRGVRRLLSRRKRALVYEHDKVWREDIVNETVPFAIDFPHAVTEDLVPIVVMPLLDKHNGLGVRVPNKLWGLEHRGRLFLDGRGRRSSFWCGNLSSNVGNKALLFWQ